MGLNLFDIIIHCACYPLPSIFLVPMNVLKRMNSAYVKMSFSSLV